MSNPPAWRSASVNATNGVCDDACDLGGPLVRREVASPGPGAYVNAWALLQRPTLLVGQPAVSLLGMNHPGRDTGLAQPLRRRFVAAEVLDVLALHRELVQWPTPN